MLEDVYKEFLYDIEIKNFTPRTIKGYRNNNKAFLSFLHNEYSIAEVGEVKQVHIKGYLMNMKKKGLSETYINTIQKNIRSFFRFCVECQGHPIQ